jgi:hypothetical protein
MRLLLQENNFFSRAYIFGFGRKEEQQSFGKSVAKFLEVFIVEDSGIYWSL